MKRMSNKTEDRVEKLLDQLEQPGLTESEIEKIEKKIAIIQKAN